MDIKVDMKTTLLETDRLILRGFEKSDLKDFYEYASVEGVGEMAGWPHHKNIDESEKILDLFLAENENIAIVYKENNKVIGSVGIHKSWANDIEKYEKLNSKKIGYVLSKDYWGKGIMYEAVSKVIDFLFNDNNIEMLTIEHYTFNNQSKRVIEKCGFNYYKNNTKYVELLDKTFEEICYIKMKNDI